MKTAFLCCLGLFLCFVTFSQPVINSFSPTSGEIGTIVSINGNNFSSSPSSNIVFFGAVKATVTNASSTSLSVIVPSGASFELITVTTLNNNLTAYSRQPFHVTFAGAGPVFTAASFDIHKEFTVGTWPYSFSKVDLDSDGKPDFVAALYSNSSFNVLKNLSTPGFLVFNPQGATSMGSHPTIVANGDADGDGDQDIFIGSIDANNVSLFKNTSTPGVISLIPSNNYATGLMPEGIGCSDLDGDGKPDLITSAVNSHTMSVYRNTGSVTNISFAPPQTFPTGFNPGELLIRDMDNDGKPDIIVAVTSASKVSIFRNTSTAGMISFDARIDIITGAYPMGLAIGDIDGDGKPEMVTSNNQTVTASVLRNTSSPGVISFAPRVDLQVGNYPQKVALGDLDGDGSLDLAVTNNNGYQSVVTLFKNNSVAGSIQFFPGVEYFTGQGPSSVSISDVDLDGLPDISIIATSGNAVSILRSKIVCNTAFVTLQPSSAISCVGGNTVFSVDAGNTVAYQWQASNGSGWIDVLDNSFFSGANTGNLALTNVSGPMNNMEFRCRITNTCGSIFSQSAILTVNTPSPVSVSIAANNNGICPGTTVVFTATPVNGGSISNYQWKKNGANVGTNSPLYTDNSLVNADLITCVLVSNATCVTGATAVSNEIAVNVTSPVTPSLTIGASANNVCAGIPVVFSANPINGGLTPTFQWNKNGMNVGTDAATYTDNSLSDNDIITCIMQSGIPCTTVNSVTSNAITMAIIPSQTPVVSISASGNNICPGTIVTFSANIANAGTAPIIHWTKNGMTVGSNSSLYVDNGLTGGDIIRCDIISDFSGPCALSNSAVSNTIVMTMAASAPAVNLGADKKGCAGDPVLLKPAALGYVSYLWQNGTTAPTFTTTSPGSYSLEVIDACGSRSRDTVNVIFQAKPSNFLPPDSNVCYFSPSLAITPKFVFSKYLWSDHSVSPVIHVGTPGTYWLQATDSNGCTGTDSIVIKSENCLKGLFFPNAFTPGNDAVNDIFKALVGQSVDLFDLTIYNRYGQFIFHSTDVAKGWDGRFRGVAQDAGVYIWKCYFKLSGQPAMLNKGTVLLLR
ncbi:MAG: cell surface receptor domain protein [Ferruginibacter sp.]|nr:cell surface receptor domain protein [Ferruginibacter sp.]